LETLLEGVDLEKSISAAMQAFYEHHQVENYALILEKIPPFKTIVEEYAKGNLSIAPPLDVALYRQQNLLDLRLELHDAQTSALALIQFVHHIAPWKLPEFTDRMETIVSTHNKFSPLTSDARTLKSYFDLLRAEMNVPVNLTTVNLIYGERRDTIAEIMTECPPSEFKQLSDHQQYLVSNLSKRIPLPDRLAAAKQYTGTQATTICTAISKVRREKHYHLLVKLVEKQQETDPVLAMLSENQHLLYTYATKLMQDENISPMVAGAKSIDHAKIILEKKSGFFDNTDLLRIAQQHDEAQWFVSTYTAVPEPVRAVLIRAEKHFPTFSPIASNIAKMSAEDARAIISYQDENFIKILTQTRKSQAKSWINELGLGENDRILVSQANHLLGTNYE
jgi:hypothetical protein